MTDLKNHKPSVLMDALVDSIRRETRQLLIEELLSGDGLSVNDEVDMPISMRCATVPVSGSHSKPARGSKSKVNVGKLSDADRVLAFVKDNPGSSGEQISAALKLRKGAMVGVRKALGRKLVMTGVKRGARYSARKGA